MFLKYPVRMLIKYYIIVIIFLVIIVITTVISLFRNGDQKDLYFVSSSPTSYYNYAFPTILYSLQNMTLVQEIEISRNKSSANKIAIYPDERLICFYFKKNMKIVDMNNPKNDLSLIYLTNDERNSRDTFLFNIPGMGIRFGYYYLKDKIPYFRGNFSINDIKEKEILDHVEDIPSEYYSEIRTSGSAVLLPSDERRLTLHKDGKLTIGYYGPELNWDFPTKYYSKDEDQSVILRMRNSKMKVCYINIPIKMYLEYIPLIVFNERKKEWKEVLFDGKYSFLSRAFDNWIVSTEMRMINEDREADTSKEVRETGLPIEYRIMGNLEITGKLLIYNIDTEKMIKYDTENIDSETILIEDNEIYYRVYDEIYKADITNDGIENKKLLVKDERVPDIHWAFLSEN